MVLCHCAAVIRVRNRRNEKAAFDIKQTRRSAKNPIGDLSRAALFVRWLKHANRFHPFLRELRPSRDK
jgi:hypothetical protein